MKQEKPRIDWDAIKQKVRAARISPEESPAADDTRLRHVLRQRAERLATRGMRQACNAETTAVLTFTMRGESYGLPLRDIAQVFRNQPVTSVPGTSPALVGIANLQGDVRSVFDLARLLGLPNRDAETSQFILLLRQRDFRVGLRVGRIDRIQRVAQHTIILAGNDDSDPSTRFIQGWTRDHLVLLRTEAFFESFAFTGP